MTVTSIQTLTNIAFAWGVRCFGEDHMREPKVRTLRLAEEVVEAAQFFKVSADQLHRLIDVVYSQKIGTEAQELGGIAVTFAVLAHARGFTMEHLFETEIQRCLAKRPEDFALRNQAKNELGLTGHTLLHVPAGDGTHHYDQSDAD